MTRGDGGETGGVIGLAPGEDALHVGSGDADAAGFGVPRDLVAGVAENGAIELGFVVELGEAIECGGFAESAFGIGGAGAAFGRFAAFDLDGGAVEEVAGDLIDEGFGVVEGEAAFAAAGSAGPLAAFIESEVLAVAGESVVVEMLELEREG